VAREVSRRKPILILKGGSSKVGARATLSHTASIAGEDAIFDAVCRQAGMIRVSQLEHLLVMAEALFSQPLARGDRIAVIGNGGQGVATVDNLAALGLDVPEFEPEDRQALEQVLPPHAPAPRNPVDFAAGAAQTLDEVRVIEKIASFDYVDGIITKVPTDRTPGRLSLAEQKKTLITAVERFGKIPEITGKPVVTERMMSSETTLELLRSARIPVYDTPQQCALAMYALVRYAEIQKRP
jgi:acyl-CoA synthetase (NDP forming)